MEPLLIVGASARAAAFSAIRGGFQPHCADLFADVDLAARCPVRRVSNYPAGLPEALAELPHARWLYTGGLENHPDLVDRMAMIRPLLGNPGAVLRAVRDPALLSDVVRQGACQFPDWRPTSDGLPTDGSWLRKGYRSAGGAMVQSWRGGSSEARYYFQRRIEGRSAAAVYIAARTRARLLGVTEQLVGAAWTGAPPFRYAGSLSPLPLRDQQESTLIELGDRLAGVFGLEGLFGVDVLLAGDVIYAVDINPRFPASVEVLERCYGFSAVELHVAACGEGRLPATLGQEDGCLHGKALLYATQRCHAGDRFSRLAREAIDRGDAWPQVADVPAAGSIIEAGRPMMTVFAAGGTWASLDERLRDAVAHWQTSVAPR
jgi:predicted ATP-grasp superfamily ATP-dependent carboligase